MRYTTLVDLHRSNELRSNLVEICYPISRIETVFAIRHDSVDIFPEFSLFNPWTYPCFRPEGFDPYPRTP